MALISCPECGKEISDKAKACPNCGCPIGGEKKMGGERKSSKKKIIVVIAGVILCVGVLGCILAIKPMIIYNKAVLEYQNGQYESALKILGTIQKYSKAQSLEDEIKEIVIYNEAVALYDNGKWKEAKSLFESIPNFHGTESYMAAIVLDEKFASVSELCDTNQYTEALELLETIPEHEMYEEMKEKISLEKKENAYTEAVELLEKGDYESASELLAEESTDAKVKKLKLKIKYETYLYECLREFRQYLKNPDSLIIHEVSFYKDTRGEENLPYCLVKYGAQNGFGGVSTGYVLFEYIGAGNSMYSCKGTCDSLEIMENDTYEERMLCIEISLFFASDKVGNVDLERINKIVKEGLYKSVKLIKE